MIGHDLTRSTPGRAIMQYDNTYGYLKEDRLLVMAPSKTPVQYRYTAPEDYARGAGSPSWRARHWRTRCGRAGPTESRYALPGQAGPANPV